MIQSLLNRFLSMGLRYMDELTLSRIDSLLEHIELIFNDTNNLTIEEIEKNNLLLRATCFSISQVGEMMVQLEKKLISEFPNLPWGRARGMRNIIVHNYRGTDIDMVYSTIQKDLPELKQSFLEIKNKFVK